MKKKKTPPRTRRIQTSKFVGGVKASWIPLHQNPALDGDRIEPEQYDGPNPYKKRRAQRHARNHDAIERREVKLYSDRRYHELVFENILAVEFANLKEITPTWISSVHQ